LKVIIYYAVSQRIAHNRFICVIKVNIFDQNWSYYVPYYLIISFNQILKMQSTGTTRNNMRTTINLIAVIKNKNKL